MKTFQRQTETSPSKPAQSPGPENPPQTPPEQIPKVFTAIEGLDDVLHGGFPENRTTLIKGSAGTGKTVLGLEFLYRLAVKGHPVIFVSFEETADAVRQNARAAGWDLAPLEKAGKFFLWHAQIDRNAITSGDFSIDSLLAVINGKAQQLGARHLMIDAIDVVMRIFENPHKERNELYRLHDWLLEQQFTTILTAKIPAESQQAHRYEFLDYMADCVVLLDLRVINQIATRRLRVIKYRGSDFCSNEYPYVITVRGYMIMPITAVQLMHQPLGDKISSGNQDLDQCLGGGYHRASAIMISGPTGSGKTTLAASFAQNACAQGRKVLYIGFEEAQEALIAGMLSVGIDLRPARNNGHLQFHSIMPEALVSEEHLYTILQRLDHFQPDHIVLDAISACKRMGSDEAAFDFLVRLLNVCKQRNITSLFTNQLDSNDQNMNISGIGISSIIDTLITLRYVETDGEIQRDLLVIKSRGAHHSNRHHLYLITDHGIRINKDVSKI